MKASFLGPIRMLRSKATRWIGPQRVASASVGRKDTSTASRLMKTWEKEVAARKAGERQITKT